MAEAVEHALGDQRIEPRASTICPWRDRPGPRP
jgi:hypothetical protein